MNFSLESEKTSEFLPELGLIVSGDCCCFPMVDILGVILWTLWIRSSSKRVQGYTGTEGHTPEMA